MPNLLHPALVVALVAPFAGTLGFLLHPEQERPSAPREALELGAFSVSLSVKDIAASRAFYETLGFSVVGGKEAQKWLILRNGTTTIGLFQGMLESNLMTFNPGWNAKAEPLERFTDVRELQRRFEAAGLVPKVRAAEDGDGPAHFMLVDPDGNSLLFDQHVSRPK